MRPPSDLHRTSWAGVERHALAWVDGCWGVKTRHGLDTWEDGFWRMKPGDVVYVPTKVLQKGHESVRPMGKGIIPRVAISARPKSDQGEPGRQI